MKDRVCWILLALILTVVSFIGCGEADDGKFYESSGDPSSNLESNNPDIELIEQVDIGGQREPKLEDILAEAEDILVDVNENVPQQDVDPPRVTDSEIKATNGVVGINPRLWIQFNEPIDKAEITLKTEAGDEVEILVIFRDATTIELVRLGKGDDFHLKPLKTYIVKGRVFDDAGNEGEVDITFKTGDG